MVPYAPLPASARSRARSCAVQRESRDSAAAPARAATPSRIAHVLELELRRRHHRRRPQRPGLRRVSRGRGARGHRAGAPRACSAARRSPRNSIRASATRPRATRSACSIRSVIRDLKLAEHGLRVVERPFSNFLPLPDGGAFRLGGEHTQAEVAKFSRARRRALPEYYAMLDRVVAVLRELMTRTPPNVSRPLRAGRLARVVRRREAAAALDMRGRRDLLDLFTKSAGELLDHWFESAPLKAALGWDSVVGNFASPYTPGSAYVLLHHVFGEVNGKSGTWGHAIGGMGAITQAMAARVRARAASSCVTDAGVARVLVAQRHARSASRSPTAASSHARCVVSNVNPKLLYRSSWRASDLDDDTRERIERYRCGSGTFRMNVALSELPDFTRRMPGTQLQPHHQSGIIDRAHPRVLRARVLRREAQGAQRRLVARADRRAGDLVDARRHARAAGPARREPVLPARAPRGRRRLGRASRHGREADDRHGRSRTRRTSAAACSATARCRRSTSSASSASSAATSSTARSALDQLFSARPLLGQGNYRGA